MADKDLDRQILREAFEQALGKERVAFALREDDGCPEGEQKRIEKEYLDAEERAVIRGILGSDRWEE